MSNFENLAGSGIALVKLLGDGPNDTALSSYRMYALSELNDWVYLQLQFEVR